MEKLVDNVEKSRLSRGECRDFPFFSGEGGVYPGAYLLAKGDGFHVMSPLETNLIGADFGEKISKIYEPVRFRGWWRRMPQNFLLKFNKNITVWFSSGGKY